MPPAATAFYSSLCFSAPKPSSQPSAASVLEPQSSLLSEKPKTLLHKHPLHIHEKLSLQFKEKILCLEIMGVDSSKALAQNPTLQTASLQSIQLLVNFLLSKGIHQKDLGRIFGMCPKILTLDIKTELNPVFNFLSCVLQVPHQDYRKVINKCPRLLISSVTHQLRPAFCYLQRLGFKNVYALAYQDAILLVSNVEKTLTPKLDYLISLGYSRDDAIGMVLRCPGLFTFSIENNFKPKFEYFAKVMEGSLEELEDFPQYFAFSLEKRIKPRHIEILQNHSKVSLSMMLKTTDDEFKELIRSGKTVVTELQTLPFR